MSRSAVALLTAVALALAGGAAQAATVSVDDDPDCLAYECWIAAHYVTAAGEATDLTVAGAPNGAALAFHDDGAEITTGRASIGPNVFSAGPSWRCTAAGHDAACSATPGLSCHIAGCGVTFGFHRAAIDARATEARIRTAGVAAHVRTGPGTNLVDVRGGAFDDVRCAPGNATRVLADGFDAVDGACAQVDHTGRTVARARGDVLGVPYDVSVP